MLEYASRQTVSQAALSCFVGRVIVRFLLVPREAMRPFIPLAAGRHSIFHPPDVVFPLGSCCEAISIEYLTTPHPAWRLSMSLVSLQGCFPDSYNLHNCGCGTCCERQACEHRSASASFPSVC